MNRFIEDQEARYKRDHPPQPSTLPKPRTTELLSYPEVHLQPSSSTPTATRPTQHQQPVPTPTSTTASQRPPTVRPTPGQPSSHTPPPHYIYTPEPTTEAPAHQLPEVTTLSTLKAGILASFETALLETNERITQGETTEKALRRDLEEQITRTLQPSQEVMIQARRVYASLASLTQAFSSHAYAVESAIQERTPGLRDIFDTFFQVQDTLHELLVHSRPPKSYRMHTSSALSINYLLTGNTTRGL